MKFSRIAGSLVATVTSAALLASCAGEEPAPEEVRPDPTEFFGYQVPAPLLTSNAATQVGASANAQLLSARVFPGVFIPGPSGQLIPNSDLASTQYLPGAQPRVVYTLAEEAVFSNGNPVTCKDFELAFVAGSKPALFGSHVPVMQQVESVECRPGAKEFTVVFKEGQGGRWRELFGPGTVVSSQAVADKAGLSTDELSQALASDDPDQLRPIAQAWRTGFNLDAFDPALQASFGPYLIESVGDRGEVTLVRNDRYYGDPAAVDRLVVWPESADSRMLVDTQALRIADMLPADPEWVDVNAEGSSYELDSRVGELTDSLTFEKAGNWSDRGLRRAVSQCIDHQAVAGESSRVAGVEVPPVGVHVVKHNDPLARHLAPIVEPRMAVDIEAARSAEGSELRVGYAEPNERKAAMVEAMRVACEPAGITIVDATEEGKTLEDLGRIHIGEGGEESIEEGSIDAFLGAVNPMTEYAAAEARLSGLEQLRRDEEFLWDDLPSLPLAANPRSFVIDRNVGNVVVYTGLAGTGWNMDRWQDERGTPDAQEPSAQ